MQTTEAHHGGLVNGFYEQMKPILDNSEQSLFIYLGDNHKACNQKFASMLGSSRPRNGLKDKVFLKSM